MIPSHFPLWFYKSLLFTSELTISLADTTRYEEFEAFAEKLMTKGVRVFEEDEDEDKMDIDGEGKGVDDEEGGEMLQDEFA